MTPAQVPAAEAAFMIGRSRDGAELMYVGAEALLLYREGALGNVALREAIDACASLAPPPAGWAPPCGVRLDRILRAQRAALEAHLSTPTSRRALKSAARGIIRGSAI